MIELAGFVGRVLPDFNEIETYLDQPVVRGVYRMHETTGIPVDVILEGIRDRGMLPDWQSFVVEAVEAGMNVKRAIAKLEPAIVDVFGPAMRDVVVPRLSTAIPADEAWRKARGHK